MKRRAVNKQKQNTKRVKTEAVIQLLPFEIWNHIGSFLNEKSLIAVRRSCVFLSKAAELPLIRRHSAWRENLWLNLILRTSPLPLETWRWVLTKLSWSRDELLDIFCDLLSHGLVSVCQWLHETLQWTAEEGRTNKHKPLQCSVRSGSLDTIQWLHSVFTFTKQDVIHSSAPLHTAVCGTVEICHWLYNTFHLTPQDIERTECASALRLAAEHGQLKVCKWLHRTFQLTAVEVFGEALDDIEFFDGAAYNEHSEVCYWLYHTFELPATNIDDTAIFCAASTGNLGLCAWLYSIAPDAAEDSWEHIFCNGAIENGQLHVCKWMQTVFPFTREDLPTWDALACAGHNGSAKIVEWLYTTFSLTPQELCDNDFYLMVRACHRGYIKICDWLYQVVPEEVRARRKRLLCVTLREYGSLLGCEWLHNTLVYSKQEVENWNLLEHAIIHENINTALWLCNTFGLQPKTTEFYKTRAIYRAVAEKQTHLAFSVEIMVRRVQECLKNTL